MLLLQKRQHLSYATTSILLYQILVCSSTQHIKRVLCGRSQIPSAKSQTNPKLKAQMTETLALLEPGTVTHFHPPLSRFAEYLDWQDYPTHLDLSGLVRDTGTATRFVTSLSSITKRVEGSKGKAGQASPECDCVLWQTEDARANRERLLPRGG